MLLKVIPLAAGSELGAPLVLVPDVATTCDAIDASGQAISDPNEEPLSTNPQMDSQQEQPAMSRVPPAILIPARDLEHARPAAVPSDSPAVSVQNASIDGLQQQVLQTAGLEGSAGHPAVQQTSAEVREAPAAVQNTSPGAPPTSPALPAASAPSSIISNSQLPTSSIRPGTAPEASTIEAAAKLLQSSSQGRSMDAAQLAAGQSTAGQTVPTVIPITPSSTSVALAVPSPEAQVLSIKSFPLYKYWKDRAFQDTPPPVNPFDHRAWTALPSPPPGSGSGNPAVAAASASPHAAGISAPPAPVKNVTGLPVTSIATGLPSISPPAPAAVPTVPPQQEQVNSISLIK